MVKVLTIMLFAVLLGACQTTPEISELQSRNDALREQLTDTERQVSDLRAREDQLEAQVQELQRVTEVLSTEKSSRVQESSNLRTQVRDFVQQQIDDLRAFLVQGDLLDYVGSALVERSFVDHDALGLVDFANPVPRPGSLTGVTGFFSAPTNMQIKVLRPLDDRYVVIWESEVMPIARAGEQSVQLSVSVGVEPDDVIAYVFPEAANVTYDKGTGDTRYTKADLALGDTIKPSSLSAAKEKRAYSLGVLAILE